MDELSRLVVEWQRTGDPRTADRVIAGVRRGAHKLAARWGSWQHPPEDVEAVALCGAWEAMRRFDAGRGCRFFTYALAYMRGYVRRYLNERPLIHVPEVARLASRRCGAEGSLPTVTVDCDLPRDRSGRTALDNVESGRDEIGRAENRALLSGPLALLPAREALVVRRYYAEQYSLEEIARELGLSRERVRQIARCAAEQLRASMIGTAAAAAL